MTRTMSRPVTRTGSGTVPAPTTGRAVCHRHPRHVWIASCPDCTAWHLASARARRDERPAVPGSRTAA